MTGCPISACLHDNLQFVFGLFSIPMVNIPMGKLLDIVGFQNGEFQGAEILIV